MPEKIRAAVTSKEITPEEQNLHIKPARSKSSTSKGPVVSGTGQSSEVDANPTAVIEQLDEEVLKELTSENDLKLFKDAWRKAIEANEEVRWKDTSKVPIFFSVYFTGVNNSSKRCLSNTMCNFESSRKFSRSSRFFRWHSCKNVKLRLSPTISQNYVINYFPEK